MSHRIYYILLCCLVFSSCQINGSFQGLYGYQDKVAKRLTHKIKNLSSAEITSEDLRSDFIYISNAEQLLSYISNFPNTYIYIWKPNCHGEFCLDLEILQDRFNEENKELIIVAEYYDYEKMNLSYNLRNPIFGIDCTYYKSNQTKKYLRRFLTELTKTDLDNLYSDFYKFNHSDYIERFDNITHIFNDLPGRVNTEH